MIYSITNFYQHNLKIFLETEIILIRDCLLDYIYKDSLQTKLY